MEAKHSNNNSKVFVSVPGKALLFGEYGVMRGGTAVAVCMPHHRMDVQFEFKKAEKKSLHTLTSAYLSSPASLFHEELESVLKSREDSEKRNLACYLSGYKNQLNGYSVEAEVSKSFSPALGFGSSSALLCAFGIALHTQMHSEPAAHILSDLSFWQSLYDSLIALQGRGSGYDVALQAWFSLTNVDYTNLNLYSFRNAAFNADRKEQIFCPEIAQLQILNSELNQFGCFVETGVRSDTRKVLREVEKKSGIEDFFNSQAKMAKIFLEQPSLRTARELCREASILAKTRGLLPESSELMSFVDECEKNGIMWKTMGAGFGDCLWVLAERKQIELIAKKINAKSLTIQHAFEDF